MVRIPIPTHRRPTHPGQMLKEEFLQPMGITQRQLADAIGVPYRQINEIVNGRRGITPSTALRLAKYLQVSPEVNRKCGPRYRSGPLSGARNIIPLPSRFWRAVSSARLLGAVMMYPS